MQTITIIFIVLLTIDISLNIYTYYALRAYERERSLPNKLARLWRIDGP
jgi:hypothetical protein